MEFISCGFSSILNPKNDCPYTGKEKVIKCVDSDIKCFKDEFGSFRYILYLNGIAVSALQIMVIRNTAIASNVITILSERQKGYSVRVYNEALKHHKTITFSNNRSDLGKLYVKKCELITN